MARKRVDESDWLDLLSLSPWVNINPCEHCNGLGFVEVFMRTYDRKGQERNGSKNCIDCDGTGCAR